MTTGIASPMPNAEMTVINVPAVMPIPKTMMAWPRASAISTRRAAPKALEMAMPLEALDGPDGEECAEHECGDDIQHDDHEVE